MMMEVVIGFISCAFIYILWKMTNRTHNKPNVVRYCLNYLVFYWSTLIGCILILPICFVRPKNVLNGKVAALIIKNLSKILIRDIEFQLRNGEILAEDRGAVIIGNHQSLFDILGIFSFWDVVKKMAPISKVELFYIWPFGLSAYLAGVVFIKRSNRSETYKQFEETSEIMVRDKVLIRSCHYINQIQIYSE